MDFTDKELDLVIAKKIDRAIFYAGEKAVFTVNFEKLIQDRINNDETLKKQLLQLVLKSED